MADNTGTDRDPEGRGLLSGASIGLAKEDALPLCLEVERLRALGITVVTAVWSVAEDHGLDDEQLAIAHFAYLLEGTAQENHT